MKIFGRDDCQSEDKSVWCVKLHPKFCVKVKFDIREKKISDFRGKCTL